MTDVLERQVVESTPTTAPLPAQVESMLAGWGYSTLDAATITSPIGRNQIWSGRTSEGIALFVKRLEGHRTDVAARLARIRSFERLRVLDPGALGFRTPALLATHDDPAVVLFEQISEGRSGAELMILEEFDEGHAALVGHALAGLHGLAHSADDEPDTSRPLLPPLPWLDGLPLGVVETLSAGEIEAWRLMQQDQDLIGALHRLDGWERDAPRTPAHCDFRVDQVMITDGALWITDWEEFRLADPARDIGAFAGEWMYRAILDIVTTRGDFTDAAGSFDHQQILERGARRISALRPLIVAFWRAYRDERTPTDPMLHVRSAAFAGWHMLDRLMAGSHWQARLAGIERAAAGVGRSILLQPERFSGVIGLTDLR
ncbi:hypothetical protein ABIB25_001669 [Nakamurella sp. UYEF19]|uniref:class V lanthionine synthetase subunit LxmK n=1 Tax=Nakamurella sp. UYEF19 TaxID=1756392 RepID=UPI00339A6BC6